MNRFFRSALFPLVVIVLLVYLASQTLMPRRDSDQKLTYSQLIDETRKGNVSEVTFSPNRQSITAVLDSGQKVKVNYPTPQSATEYQNVLEAENVKFDSKGTGTSAWWALLTGFLPFLLLIGFWIFLMNQMQGGGSKVMSFGKSRAKRMSPDSPKVTYKDVAGADEAVEELQEIKEFLENPKKFQALGARIPKGVLLYGPPGTGKTLLARATAGEAGVPFFSISGSDFVEMFVGVGASRVRDLFEQAKQASPCIIFIDEIDAVGRHRGAGLGGGHDEREQTLNQLLVEMDGFELKDNIILIAATNRPDILDPALLRPGRFDRQIVVDRPDRKGRQQILEVHAKGKPIDKVIDLDVLAASTPGFTGADLANVINEAALLAARRGEKTIGQHELEEGIMRVIAGPEKKSRLFSEKERKITAYHEMGHALVGFYLEGTDEVHKISIVSRGQALGYTISLPSEDRYLTTKGTLMDQMAMTLGGRAAEELVFNEVTTGAANDIERITSTAKQMIMRFGMSEKLGPRVLGPEPRHALPGSRDGRRAGLLRGDREGDRRRDPPRDRGGARQGAERAARAHGRAPPALGAPDRARDDRQEPVRAAAPGRVRGVRLRRGDAGRGRARVGARAREEAGDQAAATAAPGGCDAAAAGSRRLLTPRASSAPGRLPPGEPPHDEQRGEGARGADRLDGEPLHAGDVHDREQSPHEEQRAGAGRRNPRRATPFRARLVARRRPELVRPGDELADHQEARRDTRRAGVERRLVDREEECVPGAGQREREAEHHRPDDRSGGEERARHAEDEHRRRRVGRCDEREPEGQPEGHRDGGGACGYRRARRA